MRRKSEQRCPLQNSTGIRRIPCCTTCPSADRAFLVLSWAKICHVLGKIGYLIFCILANPTCVCTCEKCCFHRKGEIEHASTSGNGASGTEVEAGDGAKLTAYLAPAAVVLGLGLLVGGGYVFKSQLKEFLDYFVEVVDTWGPLRCASHATCLKTCTVLGVCGISLPLTYHCYLPARCRMSIAWPWY